MKKIISWFEKRTTLEWIGIILALTIFLLVIVVLLNRFLPNELKFNKEIYGTVSDWFTFLATAIGISFILKTFESQKEVQKAQNLITDVELKRFRIELRPTLNIITYRVQTNNETLSFEALISPSKPCRIDVHLRGNNLHNQVMNFSSQAVSHIPIPIRFNMTNFQNHTNIYATVNYTDEEGHNYEMQSIITLVKQNTSTILIAPNLVLYDRYVEQ